MDRLAKVYESRNEPDGRVRVLRVPIYAEHVRTRPVLDYETGEEKVEEIPFNRDWLERAVADAAREQAKGHTPPLHLRHNFGTALSSTATPTEPVGTFENLELADVDLAAPGEEPDVKAVVFADLVYHDLEAFAQSKRYPHRSVEVYDYREPRINSLALLGSEEPYFRFPNLRVRDERASLALTYRRGPAYAVRWEDSMSVKSEATKALVAASLAGAADKPAPVTAAAPKVEAVAPAPAPVAANAPPVPAAAPTPAPAQPAAPQADQTAAVLQQILAGLNELKAALTGGPGAGAPQAPGAGSVAPVASAAPQSEAARVVAEAVREGVTKVTAVANADLLKLETEKLVLSQKVALLERREAARAGVEKLEQEGHLVGPELRQHFQRIADAGESLESHLALARMGAPKAPPRFSDVSASASQGEGVTDPPEVVSAGAVGTAARENARRLAAEHAHLVKRGVVNTSLARFLELEAKADQGNAKAAAQTRARKTRTTPTT